MSNSPTHEGPARLQPMRRSAAGECSRQHEQGILHRDLKPSNILIHSRDRPHITDFGLAKQLETASEVTLSGQVLGSPNYMPPEQAAGRRAEIGRTGDVYSMGAILYQLLTGRPPFVGQSPAETMHQVVHSEVVSPRLLNQSSTN